MLASGTMLQGRYRIIRQIGGGGQALVYLAEDTNLGGLRAIKELTPDPNASPQEQQAAYDQFQREAQILAVLNHPNLVQVWGYFRVGDEAYLVMDYIDGQTLQEIMDQSLRFLPEAAILRWAGQLCDVLDYLHRQRPPVIFRDLKPSNVMLDRSNTVKLIDFGIVRFFRPGKATDTLRMGTSGYAPPEQYEGKGQTDARSDIYSLGATLHHLLTKRDPTQHPPFSFNTAPPRSLNPAISLHVEAAITKALAYDRVHRFQSAQEMRQALRGPPRAPPSTVTIPRPAASCVPLPLSSKGGKMTMPYQPASSPTGWMVASIICSVIAIAIIPPLFGGLAIFFGYQVYKRDPRLGQVCMTIGGMALLIGVIVGALWGAEHIRF